MCTINYKAVEFYYMSHPHILLTKNYFQLFFCCDLADLELGLWYIRFEFTNIKNTDWLINTDHNFLTYVRGK